MGRYIFLIDGFNFYHSLQDKSEYHKYKWLNYYKLASLFIKKSDLLSEVYFFTALANWNLEKKQRHQTLIKALELHSVKTVYGEFRKKNKFCNLCKRKYKSREEKETDVNIAIHLFELALNDKYDNAVIVSADSDLIPAIKAIQRNFPNKKIGIMLPIGRRGELLKQVADFHMKVKIKHLESSVFPQSINISNNQQLICPNTWK